jgi:polysaccharide biosynthesis/export protein
MNFLRPLQLLVPAMFILLVSCTPQRKLVYLQGDPAVLRDTTTFEMKLYPGDIISVELFTVNPEAFPGLGISSDHITGTDNRSAYEKGFILDKNGDVSLPYIGKIHLAGLSLSAAHDSVDQRFRQYIDEPVVVLKKLSFKVSVVGEVNRPGLYYIPNEQLTLLEGLALAGDLTNYADRTSVKILRKNGDAIDEILVDLTQKTSYIGQSKFLHPDDIIYVAPSRKKGFTTISPATAVITSLLTVIILAGTLYIRAD